MKTAFKLVNKQFHFNKVFILSISLLNPNIDWPFESKQINDSYYNLLRKTIWSLTIM